VKKIIYATSIVILIIGGLNWGVIALGGYKVDVIAGILGGPDSIWSRIAYGLVGISALFQLGPSLRFLRSRGPSSQF
jgi:uncharacterized membrane protein YuzA (DUF378 family)